MRLDQLIESKKKSTPRPSQTFTVDRLSKFAKKESKAIPAVKQTVATVVELLLQIRANPNDTTLAAQLQRYKPHQVTILKVRYNAVWITGELRLLYQIKTDKKDKTKGLLVLADLDTHKRAYRKHK